MKPEVIEALRGFAEVISEVTEHFYHSEENFPSALYWKFRTNVNQLTDALDEQTKPGPVQDDVAEFLRGCRDNWDCDEGAHGVHSSHCRSCGARKLLDKLK